MIMKARKCEDADELVALAKTCGYEIFTPCNNFQVA